MVVIGVTGAVHSGKTTLLRELPKHLPVKAVVVGESASSSVLRMRGLSFEEIVYTPDYLLFEEEVLRKQLEAEEAARRVKSDVVLVDRTIYDWFYFFIRYGVRWAHINMRLVEELLKEYTLKAKNRYDGIIFCRPVDGYRDPYEQKLQDLAIEAIISPVRAPKIYLSGSLEERVRKARDFVLSIVQRQGIV